MMSKFEEMMYSEYIKQLIRTDCSLTITVRSLYNIVQGQCPNLMKIKLMMTKVFKLNNDDGNKIELLKEIRRVTLHIETNTSMYNALNEAKAIFIATDKKKMKATRII